MEGVDDRALGSRKGRAVLKMLAVARGAPVPVDRIADALWGDEQPSAPGEQVGVLVSRLRRVLGTERVVRTDAGYALVADWIDLDELVARVGEARRAMAAGRLTAARAAAAAAVALVRGPVLPEEDGEWVEAERAGAAALRGEACRILAEVAARAGDHAAAAAAAEVTLAVDPYDEAALRLLMQAHVAAGRPASALAAYARVRERLAEDLGVSPTAATEELHARILREERSGAGVPAPARRHAAASPPPGRGPEMAVLDEALREARAGTRPVAVVLAGEGGIGKTTLLDAWSAGLPMDVPVLRGRASGPTRDLPLQPVLDALADHLASRVPLDRAALLGPEAPLLGPLLASFAVEPGGATVVGDVELGRSRLFAALTSIAARLASTGPVVLVIDDLHLADRATLAWLHLAVERVRAPLVVVTAQLAGASLLAPARVIHLGPLDLEAVRAVVGTERAAELHARTRGHPLLLAALAHPATGGVESLAAAVERRLSSVGAAASTIRAAAVMGQEIDLDVLASVLERSAGALLGDLEAGVTAGLLIEREAAFAFRHELERAELERETPAPRRALLHRRAGAALAARPGADPLTIAEHARLGRDEALLVEWARRAAEAAMARHDVVAAGEVLDTAIDVVPAASLLVARARVRMAAGRLDDAAADAEVALAAADAPEVREVAGWIAYYRRRYDDARRHADAGAAAAGGPSLRVSCAALAGRIRHGSGDLRGAAERLVEAVGEEAPPAVRGLAEVWLAQVRLHEGRPGEALEHVARAPDRLAHPFAPLHAHFVRVLALGQLGRVAEALEACDRFDRAIERSGAAGVRFRPTAANGRSWLLRWSGRPGEADVCTDRAIELGRAVFEEAWYAGLLDRADGRLLARDLDGAAAIVDELSPIDVWAGTMAWHQRHRHGLLSARLALARGDADTAAALADAVAADAGARGARRYELLAQAFAALASGRAAAEPERLDGVVTDLAGCASLDGWWLVDALGRAAGVDRWRREAAARATAVVQASPHRAETGSFVERILGARW